MSCITNAEDPETRATRIPRGWNGSSRTKSIVNSCSDHPTWARFAHTPASCSGWTKISNSGSSPPFSCSLATGW